jgi:hypothetical protein
VPVRPPGPPPLFEPQWPAGSKVGWCEPAAREGARVLLGWLQRKTGGAFSWKAKSNPALTGRLATCLGVTVPCLRGVNLPAPRPLPELDWAVCLRPNGRGQRPQSLQTKAGRPFQRTAPTLPCSKFR